LTVVASIALYHGDVTQIALVVVSAILAVVVTIGLVA